MMFRSLAVFASLSLVCCGADLTALDIMSHVAENQDKAVALRRSFIYQQHVVVTTRHFNGKLAREEKADYDVTPGATSEERKLTLITGLCQKKNQTIAFKGEPLPEEGSLDADLVRSFRDDVVISKDLFPLTTKEQEKYRYELLGRRQVEGRDTYIVRFSPADDKDIDWTGEAWIDVQELQPVRVFTQLSRKLPFLVRTMLGTDLPGVGFNVQYKRVERMCGFR